MSNKPKKKYRPVLTADEVQLISRILKEQYVAQLTDGSKDSPALFSAIGKFSTLESKIASSSIVPAYTTSPRESLMESLGAAAPETTAACYNSIDKEAYWEQCYDKFSIDPSQCTLQELDAAQEHRYLNDLMTPEEEKRFEQKSSGGTGG